MDALKIIEEARNSLSSYCSDECRAYCCRKGYLDLTGKESLAVTGHTMSMKNKKRMLNLEGGCPSLEGFKCLIHDHVDMPAACKDFPIFMWDNKTIKLSERCPAVRDNILYPYLAELKMKGYRFR